MKYYGSGFEQPFGEFHYLFGSELVATEQTAEQD